MASTTKRPPNISVPTPHPKPIVTVEEWEAAAPLGDVESRSVSYIYSATESSTLPLKVRNSLRYCLACFVISVSSLAWWIQARHLVHRRP